MRGKAPALDAREPFAHGVDLDDAGARGKKLIGNVLQFAKRQERLLKKRAAAAREQEEHRVVRAKAFRQRKCDLRAAQTVLIRHGMRALIAGDAVDRAFCVAVLGHDHTARERGEHFARNACHLPGGFARRDQKHPTGELHARKRAAHGSIRQHCADRLAQNGFSVRAQRGAGSIGGAHGGYLLAKNGTFYLHYTACRAVCKRKHKTGLTLTGQARSLLQKAADHPLCSRR